MKLSLKTAHLTKEEKQEYFRALNKIETQRAKDKADQQRRKGAPNA